MRNSREVIGRNVEIDQIVGLEMMLAVHNLTMVMLPAMMSQGFGGRFKIEGDWGIPFYLNPMGYKTRLDREVKPDGLIMPGCGRQMAEAGRIGESDGEYLRVTARAMSQVAEVLAKTARGLGDWLTQEEAARKNPGWSLVLDRIKSSVGRRLGVGDVWSMFDAISRRDFRDLAGSEIEEVADIFEEKSGRDRGLGWLRLFSRGWKAMASVMGYAQVAGGGEYKSSLEMNKSAEARDNTLNYFLMLRKRMLTTDEVVYLYGYVFKECGLGNYLRCFGSESLNNFANGVFAELYAAMHYLDQGAEVDIGTGEDEISGVDLRVATEGGRILTQVKGTVRTETLEVFNLCNEDDRGRLVERMRRGGQDPRGRRDMETLWSLIKTAEREGAGSEWCVVPSDYRRMYEGLKAGGIGGRWGSIKTYAELEEYRKSK